MAKEAGINLLTVVPIPVKSKAVNGREMLLPESPTLLWARNFFGMLTPVNWNSSVAFPEGMMVDEARNWAVGRAREAGAKFIFFVDYDVICPQDSLVRLTYDMAHHPEADIFCGVYCSKSELPQPLIFKEMGTGPWWNWKVGEVHELTPNGGCHMGLTLIRVSAFDKIDAYLEGKERVPYFLTSREIRSEGLFIGTEDLHLCDLLKKAGGRIFVDCQVVAGHQDFNTHKVYGLPYGSYAVKKSWMVLRDEGKKVALDLGCGGARNDFPDCDAALRCDARAEVEPDYLIDIRHLPFPNEFASHVMSSHSLEHFGRWEVAGVLKEWARVLKFGGTMRLIVPNVAWAAKEILAKGYADENAMNVLYGAQEAHGYARELNSHFVGFTPLLLRALVEEAGLEVISCEDGESNPVLGYNIILDARKPSLVPVLSTVPENGAETPETPVGVSEATGLPSEASRPPGANVGAGNGVPAVAENGAGADIARLATALEGIREQLAQLAPLRKV